MTPTVLVARCVRRSQRKCAASVPCTYVLHLSVERGLVSLMQYSEQDTIRSPSVCKV